MARLTVRLTPRGGADRIDGWETDAEGRPVLKARVRAAPAEGQANAGLIVLIARVLKIPKSDVALARGARPASRPLRSRVFPTPTSARGWIWPTEAAIGAFPARPDAL